MKTLISLCVLMSIAAVTRGDMPDIGGMMKGMGGGMINQASESASSVMGGGSNAMSAMIGGGSEALSAMMNTFKDMAGQAADFPKMMQMMQEFQKMATDESQKQMVQIMKQMEGLQKQGGDPKEIIDQGMAMVAKMKETTGQ